MMTVIGRRLASGGRQKEEQPYLSCRHGRPLKRMKVPPPEPTGRRDGSRLMIGRLAPLPQRFAALALAAAALAACDPPVTTGKDPFTASGETIALSGGDAGARNACFTCHGLDGQGNDAGVPRIAGLGVGYLERQMDFYAAGLRQHPEMQMIAGRLTQEERKAVSRHYAAMPGYPVIARSEATQQSTDAKVGAAGSRRSARDDVISLYARGAPTRGIPACAACHGAAGNGVGAGNPPLADQPASYLAEQMHQWRLGKRRGDPLNIMLKISQRLTPSEIEALSAYAATLPGDGPRPARREASR